MQLTTGANSETLVVQFDAAVPQYELTTNPSGVQFTSGGGQGGTYTVAGSYGLQLRISHLLWTEAPGNQFPHGTDLKQPSGVLLEARQIENYEGVVVVAMGLSHPTCAAVSTLASPARLVVQFANS